MPILREDLVVNIRRVKAFLSLRVGATRGEVPDLDTLEQRLEEQTRKLRQAREAEKRAQWQLASKDEEVARLRGQPVGSGGANGALPSAVVGNMPVFFMVGNGRSGTTWLQNILNSHPEVFCTGEGWFFNRNYRRKDADQAPPQLPLGSLYNAITESEYLRQWVERSVWTAHDDVDEHLDNLMHVATEYFLSHKLQKTGKRIVGDKTATPGVEALEEISRIYPEAKVINIIRDGRDVAVSVMHFLWNHAVEKNGRKKGVGIYELQPEEFRKREAYRKDPSAVLAEGLFTEERLTEIAKGWSKEVSESTQRAPALLGENYAEVRYENLLTQPEEEVRRLLEFLGALDASPEAAKSCVQAMGFEKLSERKQGQEDSTSVRFRKGIAGDWKNVFTENDKRIFKEQAGEMLVKLGYEKDLDW